MFSTYSSASLTAVEIAFVSDSNVVSVEFRRELENALSSLCCSPASNCTAVFNETQIMFAPSVALTSRLGSGSDSAIMVSKPTPQLVAAPRYPTKWNYSSWLKVAINHQEAQ